VTVDISRDVHSLAAHRARKPTMADDQRKARRFEQIIMPHLDSAYNLARWLTRNDADAQDVVQEACLRAFKYFDGFDGDYANAWLLKIVRNTCFTWIKANRRVEETMGLDDNAEEIDRGDAAMEINASGLGRSPEEIASDHHTALQLNAAIEELPAIFREVVILREMEDMSYREIADIVAVPIGTVMSRLARGRQLLQAALSKQGYGGRPS
jgi:RNA polymerase sigma-70 factor, ECF subfamily